MKAAWEVKPLEELTTKIGSGATPRGGKNAYKVEGLSLIRSLNVHDLEFRMKDLAKIDDDQADALSNVVVEPHDVLLNITGASIARCSQVPEDVLPARVNQHVAILRPKPNLVDSRFLTYLLVSKEMKDRLLGIGDKAGATRQALTKSQLQSFLIPLPPLEEQQRIVVFLDEAFEGLARARAHAEANLQNARDILESQLGSQFLVGSPDWVEKKMGDICGLITDGKHGDCENEDGSGYYFLSAKDVKNGTLNYDGSRQITFADFQETHRRTDLSAGDVLVTNAGTIGRTAIAQDDPRTERTTFQKSVAVLKPKREVIDSNFLELGLRANLVNLQKLSAGAAQKNLLLRDLRSFIVRMPERIEEQMRVADDFAKFQAKVELLENKALGKLQDLDDLCQSLLQKAFAGELT